MSILKTTSEQSVNINDNYFYYPKNLRSKLQYLFWSLSDSVLILGTLVACALIWYTTHLSALLVIPFVLAFISARIDDVSILTRIKESSQYIFQNRIFKNNAKPNSSQQLLGAKYISEDGIYVTENGRYIFWAAEPLNLSVLSPYAISIHVQQMTSLLIQCPNLELIATDSARSLDANIAYLKRRIEEESNLVVKRLLEAELSEISDKSLAANNSRMYFFVLQIPANKPNSQDISTARRYSKIMQDTGFNVSQLTKDEIKKVLANFFDIISTNLPDYDGIQYIEKKGGVDYYED